MSKWLRETKALALGERSGLPVVAARMWGSRNKVLVLLADRSCYILSYPDGQRLPDVPPPIDNSNPDPRLVRYYDRLREQTNP